MRNYRMLLVWCLAVMFLVLAGCGPDREKAQTTPGGSSDAADITNQTAGTQDQVPPKPEELTVWAHYENVTKEVVKSFEEKTGIKVNVVYNNMFGQKEALQLDGPAGLGPDIIYQPHDGLGQLVLEGLVQPIELDREFTDQFMPHAIEAFTLDGKIWGVPLSTDTFSIFYNKKLVPTPPETVEEVEKIAEELTDAKKDKYGFLIDPANFYFSYSWMAGYGAYIFGKDENGNYNVNDIGLNNEGAVRGAKKIQEWIKKGYMPATMNSDIMNGLFINGNVGVVVSGPWSVQSYRDGIGAENLGVAPMPKLENGVVPPTFTGVKGWMLSAFSDNKYWATELMKHMASYEASLYNYEQTGDIPPRKDIIESDLIQNDPIVSGFAKQLAHGELTPNIPAMTQVWLGTADSMAFIVQGEDAKTHLDEAVRKIKEGIQLQESQKQ